MKHAKNPPNGQIVLIKLVATNDRGLRVGEDHQNAKLTDAEVELIRSLHESGGMSYSALAEKFEISKGTVAKICQYLRRGQFAAAFRRVPIPSGE